MPEDTANKERISMTIDADVLSRIDAVCESRGESRSRLIERILRDGLDDEERVVSQMENPVFRAVSAVLGESPQLLERLAGLAGEKLTPDEVAAMREGMREQRQRGKVRSKKGPKFKPGGGKRAEG